MAELTVIRWRDIPMQVLARGDGGASARALLPDRFQEAVDAAAMVAGLIGSDDYTAQMRMDTRPCGDDLEAEVDGGPCGSSPSGPTSCCARRSAPAAAGRRARGRGRGVTETVVSSATREVVIGIGRPFVIIGERINPTGRKKLAEEMKAGDFSHGDRRHARAGRGRRADARRERRHPARRRAGDPGRHVRLVQSLTDVPLSIDSSIVAALEAGLAAYQGKPLVNSVTGEDERIEPVLPLVAKHGAAVVAITNDETGISEDPDVRFAVAEKIVRAAADHGIAAQDIVVDPLVMPIGAMGTAGRQVFPLVRRLHDELGVNSTCGASNVSFGLPNRTG